MLTFHQFVEENEGPLNKPFRTPGGPKKFAVRVKNSKGNTILVRFGDPNLSIKKNQPDRKRSYCARSEPLGNDKTKANYWSRRQWEC